MPPFAPLRAERRHADDLSPAGKGRRAGGRLSDLFLQCTGITKNFLDRLYSYEFFDRDDRSIWLGLHEVAGVKYAVTVAVCEQDSEGDMGVTSEILDRSLTAVGYRVVCAVRAYKAFAKGEAARQGEAMEKAFTAGTKLAGTLKLHEDVKRLLTADCRSGQPR